MAERAEHKATERDSLRIGKLLARAGLASRRGAADFLRTHKVCVNGEPITELNYSLPVAELSACVLTVDGKKIHLESESRVLLFHKPVGVICSHRSQMLRGKKLKTLFECLPAEYRAWFFAGRLDVSSSGLMVLSNDGDHIYTLSHPKHGVVKRYLVRTSRPLSPDECRRAEKGVYDKGEKLRFESIRALEKPAHYEILLREGRNREIRRVLERLGVFARELKRTDLGPYTLGDLKPGEFCEVERILSE